ncbi:LuxR family transcriptional regulator [Rubripirellula tenax]|nr:LuxR C-terminal-related transcriptional regulator [Rubripirellula tenax]
MNHRLDTPDVNLFRPPYFFFAYDRASRLQFVSPSIEPILGYSAANLVGQLYGDFLDQEHELNRDVAECHVRRFSETAAHSVTRAVRTREGKIRVISMQTIGVADGSGEVFCCQGLAVDQTAEYSRQALLREKQKQLEAARSKLTLREAAVLNLVMEGKLNKQMATELSVSLRTVESRRSSLIQKLNCENIAEIVAMESERRMLTTILDPAHLEIPRHHAVNRTNPATSEMQDFR